MNKIFTLLAVFAIVITVSGSMSQFRLSNGANLVQADEHDGGDPGPCCDATPPPCCVLLPEDFKGLGTQQLVDLTTTTGGDGIVGLDGGQLFSMIESIKADAFNQFDPSVVGGMFAGLDHDQIGRFDHEILSAALEAAGADLLGGLGDFDSIFGANTAFDELANLADLGAALEQDGNSIINDGVFDLFGGNLFGFK